MTKGSEILDIFDAFRKGLEAYSALPMIPHRLKARHSSTSTRLAMALRPYFPPSVSIDTDLLGADVVVWEGDEIILGLFWSSSYLSRERRMKAISFHEKEKPLLTLAFSLFPERQKMLVYRIEDGFVDYLYLDRDTFSEEVLRRCTIDEGKKDDGQLLLPLRTRRKTTSLPDR